MSKIDKNSKLFIVYNGYLAERRQPMKRIDKVMEVIGFIEDNLTEKLELDEIAEEVHYSACNSPWQRFFSQMLRRHRNSYAYHIVRLPVSL